MKIKRTLFWLLLAVGIACAAWWLFCFPYRPARLRRAVPSQAVFFSEHTNPASRWQSLLQNPVSTALLQAGGVDTAEVAGWTGDPATDALVRRLASRHVVTAYAPALRYGGAPALVFASWVGTWGQLMRWGVFSSALEDFDRERGELGYTMWSMPVDTADGPGVLSLSVVEGILVGCVSRDPAAIHIMVQRVDASVAVPPAPWPAADVEMEGSAASPDRFWFRTRDQETPEEDGAFWQCGLDHLSENAAAGWVRGSIGLCPGVSEGEVFGGPDGERDLESLAALLGDAPEALAVMPFDCLRDRLQRSGLKRGFDVVFGALADQIDPGAACFVSLLSDDYSGRALGLKVPSAVIGVQWTGHTNAVELVRGLLDEVNARSGVAVIMRSWLAGTRELALLDSTRQGLYASLDPGEKVGLVQVGGWLLLASNADALGALLRHGSSPPASATWAGDLPRHEAEAYAWFDLEATGEALGKATAVYRLAQLARGGWGRPQRTPWLERLEHWSEAMQGMGQASLWLEDEAADPQIRFELGKAP